jgi:hypothetical protein
MNIRGEAVGAGATVPQIAIDNWGRPAAPTSIPPELLEKIVGVAVLGPNDQLIISFDRDMTQAEFARVRAVFDEACNGALKGRVVAVAGHERMAVLRGGDTDG